MADIWVVLVLQLVAFCLGFALAGERKKDPKPENPIAVSKNG